MQPAPRCLRSITVLAYWVRFRESLAEVDGTLFWVSQTKQNGRGVHMMIGLESKGHYDAKHSTHFESRHAFKSRRLWSEDRWGCLLS